MNLILSDRDAEVLKAIVVRRRVLLDEAAIVQFTGIILERVELLAGGERSLSRVEAWLVLHLESVKGKVVALGLAGDEGVLLVDCIDLVLGVS